MISTAQFPPLNYLVRTLLPDTELFRLEPIIAGGFPLALFATLKTIESPKDWERLHNDVNARRFGAITYAFGDIDFFFLRDGPVWESTNRWLVADSPESPCHQTGSSLGLSPDHTIARSNRANTYKKLHDGREIRYQFVKQTQTSVEFCLAQFDLKICCIAWHKDCLYFHEGFEDAFDRQEIQANPLGFHRRAHGDMYARIYSANRAYKFAERLGFNLSDELAEFCSRLYAETRNLDFDDGTPLLDESGRQTNNPVLSSDVFQRTVRHFWEQHDTYHARRRHTTAYPSSPVVKAEDRARDERKLTIGMATYDDYDGVYFTVQAIRMYHPEVTKDTEILVIDNNPTGPCAMALKALEDAVEGYRYAPESGVTGTAVRDRIFQQARTDYVLCVDSHVLIEPGALRRLIDYLDAESDPADLLQGPLLTDDMRTCFSHFRPEWHMGMYGVWDSDQRAADPDNPPFDIPMQGLGLFACHRKHWPGFNSRFMGFGGEEGYIHEKFRASGGRTLCLPFLRWLHRFERPAGTPYRNRWEDRIRNYLIGFRELGMDTTEMEEHFSGLAGRTTVDNIKAIIDREIDNPFDFFDAIYCINLDTQPDQWNRMRERLEWLGILHRVRRFSAIAHEENHQIGCALSHRAVVEEARDRGYENVLVLEDDALFHEHALEHLEKAVVELRDCDWELFYLGDMNSKQRFDKLAGCRHIERAAGMACKHAVAYHKQVFERVIADIPTDGRIDEWIRRHHAMDQYLRHFVKTVVTVPAIAIQAELAGAVPAATERFSR